MERKIVSLSFKVLTNISSDTNSAGYLSEVYTIEPDVFTYAICNDGTIWELDENSLWQPAGFPMIPQDSVQDVEEEVLDALIHDGE